MAVVALCGLAALGLRWYRTYRTWEWWLTKVNPNPIEASRMNVSVRPGVEVVVGRPIPIDASYSIGFTNPTPPPGMKFQVCISYWLEEWKAGKPADGYTVHLELSAGKRESASDTLTWETIIPHPGVFRLHYDISYRSPVGDWQSRGSSASLIWPPIRIPVAPSPFCEDCGGPPCDSPEYDFGRRYSPRWR